MTEVNIYKQAAQQSLTFPSNRGLLTVEQLFKLPLTSKTGFDLDNVAKTVNALLKEQTEESFVEASKTNAQAKTLQLALDIVKDVISTKQDEANRAAKRKANADEKARLLEVLHGKKDAELQALTPAEIEARIAALDADA